MNKIKTIDFWKAEKERAVYVIERIHKKRWDVLPSEYEQDPEKAVKHFLEEIKHADEKIKSLSLEN